MMSPNRQAMRNIIRSGFLVLLFVLLVLRENVPAELYEWVDRDGTAHFTDDIANIPVQFRPKAKAGKATVPPEPFQDGGLSGIRVYGIDIVSQGIYSARTLGAYPARTISQEVAVAADAKLLKRTSTVTASLGTIFGITYVVRGHPSDGRADITVSVSSPPLCDPSGDQPTTEQSWQVSKEFNRETHDFYVFEKDWELVPGTWTIAILYRGKLLGSRSFDVRTDGGVIDYCNR